MRAIRGGGGWKCVEEKKGTVEGVGGYVYVCGASNDLEATGDRGGEKEVCYDFKSTQQRMSDISGYLLPQIGA